MILGYTDQEIDAEFEHSQEIRVLEKNQYAEVQTPAILINELLDQLPPSVWSDPDKTWLDPAAGPGNFPMLIYKRLRRGLAKRIPDLDARNRHIFTKMLFMVELNKSNVARLKKRFGSQSHIYSADFLETEFPESFDFILGNPPFQTPKKTTYVGAAGGRTLWDDFILRSLSLLKPGGFLGFITPAGWRRPESKLYRTMTQEHSLRFLHIYGKSDGIRIFGVETRFDSYIIQNTVDSKKTRIVDELGHSALVDVRDWPFLPNSRYPEIRRILVLGPVNGPVEGPGNGIPVIFDSSLYDARKLSKKKTKRFQYPVVHTITQEGLGIRWAESKSDSQFGVPKVLLNFNENQYPYNDFDGKYGMSQLTFGIPIHSKKEGDQIIDAVRSPAFRDILTSTKWGAFQTDYRMFKYFRPDFYRILGKPASNKTRKNRAKI